MSIELGLGHASDMPCIWVKSDARLKLIMKTWGIHYVWEQENADVWYSTTHLEVCITRINSGLN